MTTLAQSLHQQDLGHIRIIAQLWGIELNAKERKTAQEELSKKLLDPALINEMLESLADDAKHAITTLQQNQGKITWDAFTRQFGEIREMGIGKRDREKPYLSPVSVTETLFYRAILARAFFDTPQGAQEFAYIPADLLEKIQHNPLPLPPEKKTFGRPARPEEYKNIRLANDRLLDDLTTYLAALRQKRPLPPPPGDLSPRFTRDLLLAARLITAEEDILLDTVKPFLEADRQTARRELLQAWQKSESFNELWQTPELICEGEWRNAVLDTRIEMLDFLRKVPEGTWWSLKAFIADIKENRPDFQRKGGEYNAWFIRRRKDNTPLRGFESWDEVEGALLRYFFGTVLYWLGIVDIAAPAQDGSVTAFRRRQKEIKSPATEERIFINSQGKISVSRSASRAARYLISRFCEWEQNKTPDEYRYQITAASLTRAKQQNLAIDHLLGLLKKFATAEIPPNLLRALRRWEQSGTEARVEKVALLRLRKPEDLRALRQSRAGRFLGEAINPTTVIIQEGAAKQIAAALIEMGIFTQTENGEIITSQR